MDFPQPSEPHLSSYEVTVTDEAIIFTTAEGSNCIYLDPKLNHTPVQCAHLMKLRRSVGDSVEFRDSTLILRAVIAFPADDVATLTVLNTDGGALWADTLDAAESLPDSPDFVVPSIRPMYRALTAAVMLFLLVWFPILLLYPSHPTFATEASIGILLVVSATVGILIVIRTWLKL